MMPPSTALTAVSVTRATPAFVLPQEPLATLAAESGQPLATIVAQTEPDVLSDIGGAFKGFYESGQIWALLIGFILGYAIRGITTYK